MAVNSMGSSLNVDSIVTSLMKPYQAKVSAVNKEISAVQSTISNLGKLKSGLSELKDSLQKVENNQTTPLSVDDLKPALKGFVKEYNESKALTKDSNDMNLKRFTEKLRREIDPTVAASIGLSFDKVGLAQFDENKFNTANTTDSVALTNAVNSVFDTALGNGSAINSTIRNGGSLDYSKDLLSNKVNSLTKKKEGLESKMSFYEDNYRKQFTTLQNMLNQLGANEGFITNFNKK